MLTAKQLVWTFCVGCCMCLLCTVVYIVGNLVAACIEEGHVVFYRVLLTLGFSLTEIGLLTCSFKDEIRELVICQTNWPNRISMGSNIGKEKVVMYVCLTIIL